ncbi:MAG TPA: hypothetical protein VK982_01500 [Bacteroidales bacterium]|nr:hypothetical protein [Bacteroidales bacterium]
MLDYLLEFTVKPVYNYLKCVLQSFITAIAIILYGITGFLANILLFGKEWEFFSRRLFEKVVEKFNNGEI